MADACRATLDIVAPLIAAKKRVVLYIAVGSRAAGLVPFRHVADASAPAHTSVTLLFGAQGDAGARGKPVVERGRDGSAVIEARERLPISQASFYSPSGAMGRLLDTVVTDGMGCAVALFAAGTGRTEPPPMFRYVHFARAVYRRMLDNNWSTVLDGKQGAYVRCLMLFGDDLHLGEGNGRELVGFHLMFPSARCDRTYVHNTAELPLSGEFDRLWFYAGCGADNEETCSIAKGVSSTGRRRKSRKELLRRVAVLRAALARDEAALGMRSGGGVITAAEPNPGTREPAAKPAAKPAAEPAAKPAAKPAAQQTGKHRPVTYRGAWDTPAVNRRRR